MDSFCATRQTLDAICFPKGGPFLVTSLQGPPWDLPHTPHFRAQPPTHPPLRPRGGGVVTGSSKCNDGGAGGFWASRRRRNGGEASARSRGQWRRELGDPLLVPRVDDIQMI